MARLTKAQREEKAQDAVALSARGVSYQAIGNELEVSRQTAKKLIEDELAGRAEHRAQDKERHLAVYGEIQAAAWERFKDTGNTSLNASGYLNTILSAEQAKVKLTGAEAASRHEHSGPGGGPIEQIKVVYDEAEDSYH